MTDVVVPPLVTAARQYLGVPFRHRGRTARGLDCVGLGWRAYADLGVVLPDLRQYGREPRDERLLKAIKAALGEPVGFGPTAELQPGDVPLFDYNDEPHHVGIVGWLAYGALSLIHADSIVGEVVEHRLDDAWCARMSWVFRRGV